MVKGYALARGVAKAWGVGSPHSRGANSGLAISGRLQVMKGTLIPAITTFARSRAWTKGELMKLQRVANYAVRRAMGMDIFSMREHHVSDEQMYQAAGWESVTDHIRRATLVWIGHVARMPTYRRPKQALFGWWADKMSKSHGNQTLQSSWLKDVVRSAGITHLDWFRQAQDRKGWRRTVQKAYPGSKIGQERREALDRWKPDRPLPGAESTVENEAEGANVAGIERQEDVEGHGDGGPYEEDAAGGYSCPVCNKWFLRGNQLQWHYDEEHGIRDPELVTLINHRCDKCKVFFARGNQLKEHIYKSLLAA